MAMTAGTSVSRDKHDSTQWQVEVFLTPAGSDKFAQFTKENLGKRIAIYFDDRYEMAPQVRAVVTDGQDKGQSIEWVRDSAGRVQWVRVTGRIARRDGT